MFNRNFNWIIYVFIGVLLIITAIFGGISLFEQKILDNTNVSPGENWTNVSYANVSSAEKMDIYLPKTEGPYPVIIWIHGGGFLTGDKSSDFNTIKEGLNRGYAVVSINYRLGDEARFPAPIYDVKAAVKYLRANSQTYNLDPNKFALWGGSAGGTLAALAGTSGDVPGLENTSMGYPNVSDKVQAVVDEKGPINFGTMLKQLQMMDKNGNNTFNYNQSEVMAERYLGANVTLIPNQVDRANPENYITPDDPPFLIIHGTGDKLIPYQQSVDFANKLKSVLGSSKVTLILVPNINHGDPYYTSQKNIKIILDWLDKNMK